MRIPRFVVAALIEEELKDRPQALVVVSGLDYVVLVPNVDGWSCF